MRILGIDPGTAIVGYGLIDTKGSQYKVVDYGCIRTSAEDSIPERLLQIFRRMQQLIDEYQPECLVVEELFFNKNANTAMAVGQARGVIVLSGIDKGLPVFEYTPLQVKQAIVGYGRAEKRQVQEMVKLLLNLEKRPSPDDVADALAIAICHAHSHKLKRLLS
ncbi:MAG: crossover junction endodeoxyribonuclease RuvC [Clostridia bacterium]|jgi:crossover junction endodeoxyribonuclease RuvC|nr:crossover junction endodeoxyribonuclease RuvC [Clostridia bacterium]